MKLTERGQITIPKELRDRYGISSGSEIELVGRPDGILIVTHGSTSLFPRFVGAANASQLPAGTDALVSVLRDSETSGAADSTDEGPPVEPTAEDGDAAGRR